MLRALDIAALVDAFDDSLERIDVVLEDRFRPRELNLLAQWLLDRRERVRFHLSESLAEQTNLCRQLSESGFRTTVSCEPAGAVYGSGCAAEGPQGGRQWIILPDGRVYADLRHSPLGMVTDTLSRLRLRMERERQSPGAQDAGGPDREES